MEVMENWDALLELPLGVRMMRMWRLSVVGASILSRVVTALWGLGAICFDGAHSEMWCTWFLELNRKSKTKRHKFNAG